MKYGFKNNSVLLLLSKTVSNKNILGGEWKWVKIYNDPWSIFSKVISKTYSTFDICCYWFKH